MSAPTLPTLADQMNDRPNAYFVECDSCATGIVERRVNDYAPDSGVGYEYLNGCSGDHLSAYCAACTAAGKVA